MQLAALPRKPGASGITLISTAFSSSQDQQGAWKQRCKTQRLESLQGHAECPSAGPGCTRGFPEQKESLLIGRGGCGDKMPQCLNSTSADPLPEQGLKSLLPAAPTMQKLTLNVPTAR